MASSKDIQRILTCLHTSFLDPPDKVSSSSSAQSEIVSCLRHHALLSSTHASAQSTIQDWTKTVSSLLRSPSDRVLGLRLLKETLRQCSTDVFKANFASWFRQLNSIAFSDCKTTLAFSSSSTTSSSSSPSPDSLALECLSSIVSTASSLPECAREMTAKDNLPSTVISLLNLDSKESISLLKSGLACLIECAKSFPGATGSVGKGKLEKKSVEILQDSRLSEDEGYCADAALFFALLPKMGGAGVGGARYREAWESQFSLLTETLSHVVDELFRDVPSLASSTKNHLAGSNNNNESKSSQLLPLDPIRGEDENFKRFRLLNRFRVLMKCLSAMLSTDVGVSVRIPFGRVLTLLFRLCNVSPSSLTFKPTNEALILAGILPEIFSSAVRVLSTCLGTAGNRLFNHGLSINRLILQMLNCTLLKDDADGGRTFGLETCFQKCRSEVYDFFASWLYVYPSIRTGTKGESALKWLAHILRDAKPPEAEKATLKSGHLSNGTGGGGGAGKKNRKKMKGGILESSSVTSDRKIDATANADVCASALKAASALVLLQGRALPPEIHKSLVEFSIPLSQSICLRQRTNLPFPIPYSDSDCRLALFDLLKSLVLNPSPKWPPPLAAASAVFRQGVADRDERVRRLSAEANVVVANLVHPRVHPIQMPIVFSKDLAEEAAAGRKRKRTADMVADEADLVGAVDKGRGRDSMPASSNDNDDATSEFKDISTNTSIDRMRMASDAFGGEKRGETDDVVMEDENEVVALEKEDEEEEEFGKQEVAGSSTVKDTDGMVDENAERQSTLKESSAQNLDNDPHQFETQPSTRLLGGDAEISSKSTLKSHMTSTQKDNTVRTKQMDDESFTGNKLTKDGEAEEEEEDPELAAMLNDFNPDADPDPY